MSSSKAEGTIIVTDNAQSTVEQRLHEALGKARTAETALADLKSRYWKRVVQFALLAVVVVAIGTSFWPGYVLRSNIATYEKAAGETATVAALAPICADQFAKLPDAEVKFAALAQEKSPTSSAARTIITDSGAAVMPGSDKPNTAVVQACTTMLHELAKQVPAQ